MLESNEIHRLSSNSFNGQRFLYYLNLRGNKLHVLESHVFSDMRNLSFLSLSDNPLLKIEPGAFRNLENLKFFHLDMCSEPKLEINQHDLFVHMPHLQHLMMMNSPEVANGFLNIINPDHERLPGTPHNSMIDIDMTYNNIPSLNPKLKYAFPEIRSIGLDGNSWIYDGNIIWLQQWMNNSDIELSKYEPVTCQHPPELYGATIRNLTKEQIVLAAANPNGLLNRTDKDTLKQLHQTLPADTPKNDNIRQITNNQRKSNDNKRVQVHTVDQKVTAHLENKVTDSSLRIRHRKRKQQSQKKRNGKRS